MSKPLIYEVFDFIPASPMEDYIARALVIEKIKFKREVEFHKCTNPLTGACLRFDFVLFDYSVIIEYDGKEYHADQIVKDRDKLKNEFALKHGIKVFRMQGYEMVDAFFKKCIPNLEKVPIDCQYKKSKSLLKKEAKAKKKAAREARRNKIAA